MLRILLAGLDLERLARALRDAGHEVVAVAAMSPDALVATAVQEDVDSLCLAHGPLEEELVEQVRAGLLARGAQDVALVAVDGSEADGHLADLVQALTAGG